MSGRQKKNPELDLTQDEHSHSLPLLREWLNDVTCQPTSSHSSSRDSLKHHRVIIRETERPKTTEPTIKKPFFLLPPSPVVSHLSISNSISPSKTSLQHHHNPIMLLTEAHQPLQHPYLEKLLVFSNVHEELTRQAAFHCPSLANLLHRSWSGVSSLASAAVTKLHEAETRNKLTDSRCEKLTSELSTNVDGIVSERNSLRSENKRLQGQCDDHESDALRHRKELALALMDAESANFRLEKMASAALSGSARILTKSKGRKGRNEKEEEEEEEGRTKEKNVNDDEHEVNAVTSRGILELTLLFSELEKERIKQKSLAEELKAYVGSTALTIMLQNQWWLPKPSRSVGVQWIDDPPPPPPPVPTPLPIIDRGPYVLPILAKKRPKHVDLPFEIRILLKTFSFANGPRLIGLGQAKRLVLQLLLDKASVDKASMPLQGMRASFASCTVEYFAQKFGLAQLSDLRVIEIVVAVRAHAHHLRQQQQQNLNVKGGLGGTMNLSASNAGLLLQGSGDHPAIVPLNARGGGAPDLLMRMSDLFIGATSVRDDGRPWLQQGPLDAIVTFLDELRLSKELIRDRVTGTGDITPGELEGTFPVSRSMSLCAAKEALSPFLYFGNESHLTLEESSSLSSSSSSCAALVESIVQMPAFCEIEGGGGGGNTSTSTTANDLIFVNNDNNTNTLDIGNSSSTNHSPSTNNILLSSMPPPPPPLSSSLSAEPLHVVFGDDRVDVIHAMRVVILHWSLEQCDWEVRLSSVFDSCSTQGLPYTSERSREMLTSSISSKIVTKTAETVSPVTTRIETIEKQETHKSNEVEKEAAEMVMKKNLIDNRNSQGQEALHGSNQSVSSNPTQSRYSRPFVRLPPPPLKSKRSSSASSSSFSFSSSSSSSSSQGGRGGILLPSDKLWQPPASLYKSSKKSGALDYSLEKKRENENLEKRRKSVEAFESTSSLLSFVASGSTMPTNAAQNLRTAGEGTNMGSIASNNPSRRRQQQLRFSTTPVFRPEDLFMVDVDAFADARYTRKGTTSIGELSTEAIVTIAESKNAAAVHADDAYIDRGGGGRAGGDVIDEEEGGEIIDGTGEMKDDDEVEKESTAIDTVFLHHALSVIESPVPSSQLLSSQALNAIADALLDDKDESSSSLEMSKKEKEDEDDNEDEEDEEGEEGEGFRSKHQGQRASSGHRHHLTTSELLSSSAVVGRIRRANVYANRKRRHSVPTRASILPVNSSSSSSSSSHHPNSHRSQSSSTGGYSATDSHSSANWPSGGGGSTLMRRRSSTSTMTGVTVDDEDMIVEEEGDSRSSTRSSTGSNNCEAESSTGVAVRSASASASLRSLPPRRSSSLLLSGTILLNSSNNNTSSSLLMRNKGAHVSRKYTKSYAIADLSLLAARLLTARSMLISSNRSRRKISLTLAITALTMRDPLISRATIAKAFEHARWRLEEAAHNVKVSGWVRTVIPAGALEEMAHDKGIGGGGGGEEAEGRGGGGGRPTSPLNIHKPIGMHSSLSPVNHRVAGRGGGVASRNRPRHFYWRNPRTGQVSLSCPEIERERVKELDYTSFAEMCLRHGFLRNGCEDAGMGGGGGGGRIDGRVIGGRGDRRVSASSSKALRRLVFQEHLCAVTCIQSWWRRWSWARNQPRRAREKAEKIAFDAKKEAEMLQIEAERALKLANDAEILQQVQLKEEGEEEEAKQLRNDNIDDNGLKIDGARPVHHSSAAAHDSAQSSSRTNMSYISGNGGGGGRRGSVEQMISNARLRIAQREAIRKHDEAMRAEAIATSAIAEADVARANSLRVDEVRSLLLQSKRGGASHHYKSTADDNSLSIGLESSTSVALRALRQFGKRFSFSKAYSPSLPPFLHDQDAQVSLSNSTPSAVGTSSSSTTTTTAEMRVVSTPKNLNPPSSSSSSSRSRPGTADHAQSRREEETRRVSTVSLPSSSSFLSELGKLEAQEAWWDSLTPRSRNSILLQAKKGR